MNACLHHHTASSQTALIVQPRRVALAAPLRLDCGRTLRQVDIVYEQYGELDAGRANAVLVCHGLTSDHHAAGRHDPADRRPGWWDQAIGPGKAIDTRQWCVIAPNALGGGASTGPTTLDPDCGRPYGQRFPIVTIGDMVRAQAALLDTLGIGRLHAAIGGCMGGFQVLTWMADFPGRLARAVAIGTTARVSAYTIALWKVMSEAIRLDPDWQGGDYYGTGAPTRGLQLMSRIGALIWIERGLLEQSYGNRRLPGLEPPAYDFTTEFEVEALFDRIGQGDAAGLDVNALMYLMRAMDYFDLQRGHPSLAAAFGTTAVKTLLVSYSSDWRYPPSEIDEIRAALQTRGWPVVHERLDSPFGHGAFLHDFRSLDPVLRTFLQDRTT